MRSRRNIVLRLDEVVESIEGATAVEGVRVRSSDSETSELIDATGIFVCIGLVPQTAPFQGVVELDGEHRVRVDSTLATSAEGVFAAGVVRSQSPDQLVTALADGVTAARHAHRWLAERGVDGPRER